MPKPVERHGGKEEDAQDDFLKRDRPARLLAGVVQDADNERSEQRAKNAPCAPPEPDASDDGGGDRRICLR